jgi:hypothetical protein
MKRRDQFRAQPSLAISTNAPRLVKDRLGKIIEVRRGMDVKTWRGIERYRKRRALGKAA